MLGAAVNWYLHYDRIVPHTVRKRLMIRGNACIPQAVPLHALRAIAYHGTNYIR